MANLFQTIQNIHKEYKSRISDCLGILYDLVFYNNSKSTEYLKLHAVELISQIHVCLHII